MSESILSIKNVTKVYGDYTALNDVSFEVPKGSVFGLLGPNGKDFPYKDHYQYHTGG